MKSKHKKSKLYWELVLKLEENDKAQRALGYKLLDEPIPNGYIAHWELRDDIARREDAWLFESILRDLGKTAWCKNKDFKHWNWKQKFYEDVNPYIKLISEDEYDRILPQYQHWFEYAIGKDKVRWGGVIKYYECNIPDYFFKRVIERDYKTHYKVIDEVLKQEEAELEDRLDWEFRGQRWSYSNAPKWYRKTFHVKEKNKCKRAIRKAMKNGEYDYIPENFNHKHCANWYWW
jgi:hypothetical protein